MSEHDRGPATTAGPSLNPAQQAAVAHGAGPLLVIAGAGSGKTRVLTARIARLIEEGHAHPSEILAVTFTNKAAGEMRERVGRFLGHDPAGMWIGTFHGIGARMLRANAEYVGRTREYTIYDEDDFLSLVKRMMDRLAISQKQWSPKALIGEISSAKNALVDVGEYATLALTPLAKAAAKVYKELEPTLRAANAVTFDDLLTLPVQILREQPAIAEKYARRFKYVLVDEYQDTNRAQYEFVRLIGGGHGNVAVVGDDDQAIYGWRGADVRNILDFERDFPRAIVVRLEENYRSYRPILDLANVVIRENAERLGKELRTTRAGGELPTLLECADDRDEADSITELVQAWHEGGRPYGDAAILYRTNAQSRGFEEAMRRRGIPYRLVGAVRFYDRREIRDLLAWLRLVANPADDEAFRRAIAAPKRGIGETTVEMLAEQGRGAGVPLLEVARRASSPSPSSASSPFSAVRPNARQSLGTFVALIDTLREMAADTGVDRLLTHLIQSSGYDEALRAEGPEGLDRLDNVRELVTSAAETIIDDGGEVGLRPLDHFLQRATLITNLDQLGPDADAVTMMTVHTAKGLEYGFVAMTGMEEGLFPLQRAYDEPERLEEERRLLYVAITRAKDQLVLSWANQRRRNGELLASVMSFFLRGKVQEYVEPKRTVRVRSTASFAGSRAYGGGWDSGRERGFPRPPASFTPTWTPRAGAGVPSIIQDEDASQDTPAFVAGERVKHARFGSGSIAEVSGSGKDAKVTVDFDDEEIGRKKLLVAFAGLERGFD